MNWNMEDKGKHILKGISLTIISAIFAVFGIVVANTESLIAGILIVVASSLFWGYACLLSGTESEKQVCWRSGG